jgi:hypothetical protein
MRKTSNVQRSMEEGEQEKADLFAAALAKEERPTF